MTHTDWEKRFDHHFGLDTGITKETDQIFIRVDELKGMIRQELRTAIADAVREEREWILKEVIGENEPEVGFDDKKNWLRVPIRNELRSEQRRKLADLTGKGEVTSEFPKGKEAYCPRCYFEDEKTILRSECPHRNENGTSRGEV